MSDSAGNAKKGTIEVAISQASETRERVTVEPQNGAEAYASILIRVVSWAIFKLVRRQAKAQKAKAS